MEAGRFAELVVDLLEDLRLGWNMVESLEKTSVSSKASKRAAKAIGQSLAKLGASAAFLVTDQGVTGAGITAQLEGYITEAGIECVVFDQVEANPTMPIVSP